jgi:hypothetical protein
MTVSIATREKTRAAMATLSESLFDEPSEGDVAD